MRLECVISGVSGSTEPSYSTPLGGQLLTDGTVIWIIDDIRDCTPVGSVRPSLVIPVGYIIANGSTVNRADYPRLTKWATDNELIVDSTSYASYPGLFGEGDGVDTLVLPDYRGQFIRYNDSTMANDSDRNSNNKAVGSNQDYAVEEFHVMAEQSNNSYNITWTNASFSGSHSLYNHLVIYNTYTFQNNIVSKLKPYKDFTETDMNQGSDTRPMNISMYPIIRY